MFILDKIFLSPLQGALWVAKAVEEAANDAQAKSREDAAQQLKELYRAWEAGDISDEAFDTAEQVWVDILEGRAT